MAEKFRGAPDLARFQKRADISRGDGHAVFFHTRDDVAAEAVGGAVTSELFHIALIFVAEAEVMSRDKVHSVVLPDEKL